MVGVGLRQKGGGAEVVGVGLRQKGLGVKV